MPGGGEELEVIVKFGPIFAGDEGRFGAEAVDQCVEANIFLAWRRFGGRWSVGRCVD
jgi:hypothetical protein